MKNILLLLLASISFEALAQAPAIQWQNTIGGSGQDGLSCIQQTADGGYILGGVSNSDISADKTQNSRGVGDFWVLKLDATGHIQWQNTIGGNSIDQLNSIQQTSDGGYVLGGSSNSQLTGDKTENNLGEWDYWVVKLDASGNIQWQNTLGGTYSDFLNSIQQTKDGGYILGGTSISNISGDKTENSLGLTDYWIIKLDTSGDIQWQNTIGGINPDGLSSIQLAMDGGYLLGGYSSSPISGDKTENGHGEVDYWVLKLDDAGNIQWQKTIGAAKYDDLKSIRQTSDGGYILGGSSFSNTSGDKTEDCQGDLDYWVVKLDASGDIQWQNTIGGDQLDELYAVQETMDGGYIIGGSSYSNISGDKTENSLGFLDYWIVKLDISGNIQWQNTIGGAYNDDLRSFQQTTDGGYIIGGTSTSNSSTDKTENSLGEWDYWVIKLFPDSSVNTIEPIPSFSFNFLPNPFGDRLELGRKGGYESDMSVRFFDHTGKLVAEHFWPISETSLAIPTNAWPPGLYFSQVLNGKGHPVFFGKLVKVE